MQGKTYKEISELSREDLVSLFDHENKNVWHGLDFIKEEIWRHDSEQFNLRMQRMTSQMGWLTWVITILTVVNVGFVIYSVMT